MLMEMKDKKLTVTGAIDPVVVVGKLRKRFTTEILSIGPAKEAPAKEAPKKDDAKKDEGNKNKGDNKGNKDGKDQPKGQAPMACTMVCTPGQPYYYPGLPPPWQYYYWHRSVEEDPTGCIIC